MTRFVWRDGRFRHPGTNEPMPIPARSGVCAPMIQSDIEPFQSPIDGKYVGGRSQKRYDLEANGCVEAPPKKKFTGFRNKQFARKHGLPLSEEVRDG